MKLIIYSLLIGISFTGVLLTIQPKPGTPYWLIGTWENKSGKEPVYELWTQNGKNLLTGKSYMVKGTDTLIFETVQLKKEGELWYYIPTVSHQNKGKPVIFKGTTITEHQMVFENPEHDFPQTITYTKITPDSLVAEISGNSSGKFRSVLFPMKKLN